MYKVRAILTGLCMALMPGVIIAQSTKRLTATKANEYGLVYILPVTAVDVTVEAEITVDRPGEFARYAKKYLNIDNPIVDESRRATIKSVMINTHGVANSEERYVVTLKSGFAPYIDLTADNIPLSLNIEGEMPDRPELPVATAAKPTPLETAAARQVVTEEMLQSHSSAKRAELAAAQIYALRQSRTDLITGQAEQMPPDGKAMELVMSTIDAQEAALMAMFVGTTSTSTDVRTYTIVPTGDEKNVVIGRLSAIDGLVSADNLSGMPIDMTVKILSRGEMPVNEKGETLEMPRGGVAYCIPGSAEITVSANGRVRAEKTVSMAQLGVVYGVAPASFTDKKAPAYIKFDPATGAIVSMGQSAVNK